MKIVMAPVNIAGQPILLVQQLQKMGIDARLVQFMQGSMKANKFGYETDEVVMMTPATRPEVQLTTLGKLLDDGTDIFHFWLRSMVYGRPYKDLQGLDLPIIKAHGRKVVYRFTGFDLRLKSDHMRVNPYNPFQYGYDHGMDEDMQRRYLSWLRSYVDEFVVQDPEMGEFMPGASVIPRSMDMSRWDPVGVDANKKRPLVIHSPSKTEVKGTRFVLEAVEQLQREGLEFDFKLIQDMKHAEAIELYKQCDIAIDQLLIGWYGVFSLETMALAKPTIVYVRDEPLSKAGFDLPIQNANPDTVTDKLRELILDGNLRKDLGERGRVFVEEVHAVERVAEKAVELYSRVLDAPPTFPEISAAPAMDYISRQVMDRQEEVLTGANVGRRVTKMRRRAEAAEKQSETTQENLKLAQRRLVRTRKELASVQADFTRINRARVVTRDKLAATSERVTEVESALAASQRKLAAARQENERLTAQQAQVEKDQLQSDRARRNASLPRKAALKFFNEGASGFAKSAGRRFGGG